LSAVAIVETTVETTVEAVETTVENEDTMSLLGIYL
jgi:hypothetical protein